MPLARSQTACPPPSLAPSIGQAHGLCHCPPLPTPCPVCRWRWVPLVHGTHWRGQEKRRGMVRSKPPGRPGQSPEAGQQPSVHGPDIGRPPGILSQEALLGLDAIQQRRPSLRRQQDGAAIPLCTVDTDVREDIGEVERMAHQPIRSCLGQAAQGLGGCRTTGQG